jgi:hypothetical protein
MSTVQYRQPPTYTEQIATGQRNNQNWYRYFTQAELGTPPSGEVTLSPVSSPFAYTAPSKGFVIVSGGTVTSIMFSRTQNQFYLTGQTSGMFPVSQNDVLKVTFTAAPTMVFVPT